jgi:predicted membrane channel-forming protein YqfA (hemolysin III family)
MIPAIQYAYSRELYLLSAGFLMSMTSSFFYHLCDTDNYCLLGLSFKALQIFDILFCNTVVFAVLVLYSKIRQQLQETLILCFLGSSMAFIANNPTNPMNLILTLSSATVVIFSSWIYYAVLKYRGIPSLFRFYQLKKAPVSQHVDVAVEEQSLLEREIEMPERPPNREPMERRSLLFYRRTPLKRGNPDILTRSRFDQWDECIVHVRSSILGFLSATIGLSFFASQTRSNYWIFHSSWHVFVMIGAFLCVKGKFEFFDFLQRNAK